MGFLDKFKNSESWSFVGTVTADPQFIPLDIMSKLEKDTLEKILFGYTTYVWQNDVTGELKRHSYIGTDETPLKSILNKVDQWGKYEILVDGKKYVIAKVPNQVLPVVEQVSPVISDTSNIDLKNLPVR